MTKIYVSNLTFIFDIVFDLGNNPIRALFLTLEFGVIFDIFTLKNNGH